MDEKMKMYLESEVGQAVLKLLAYTVNTSTTTKDDEIVGNVYDVIEVIADAIDKIDDKEVTVKEAKAAALVIITKIAEATPTKWDDRLIPILDMFL